MADRKRLKKFQERMAKLQKSVSFKQYKETVILKILDYARQNPNADLKALKKEITEIFGEPFGEFSDQLFSKYDDIIEVTNKLYTDIGEDITRDHNKIAAIEKVNSTRLGKYEKRWVTKLAKGTRRALVENVDHHELRTRIKRIGGSVSEYADVLASTQIKGYSREVKYQKATIGEVYWYEYMGNRRKTTRAFCRDKIGKHFHIDEIRKMDNGPKQLKPVITYGGGWGCLQDWEPDPFYKPSKERIEEMEQRLAA